MVTMKYILTLFLLAGFVGYGASSQQIGGEFADFRKPAGLHLGMNADDCGKLRDKDGTVAVVYHRIGIIGTNTQICSSKGDSFWFIA